MIKKILLESKLFIIILIAATAIGIGISAVSTKADLIFILPLYVSLMVMLLQSNALRIGSLIGGLNCLIYTAIYLKYGLYGSALTTFLVSFPMQLITFFNWSRRKDGSTTRFRVMKKKWLILTLLAMAVAYVPLLISNKAAGGSYSEIDTLATVLGFTSSLLMLFAFKEYVLFQLVNSFIAFFLYAVMLPEHPEQICYFIYNIYATVCIVRGVLNINIIYKRQMAEDMAATKPHSLSDTASA